MDSLHCFMPMAHLEEEYHKPNIILVTDTVPEKQSQMYDNYKGTPFSRGCTESHISIYLAWQLPKHSQHTPWCT